MSTEIRRLLAHTHDMANHLRVMEMELEALLASQRPPTDDLIEQRVVGHGEGQEHAMTASDLAPLRGLIDEMRMIGLVAGQCSVEGPEGLAASMAGAEAERALRWADELEALLGSQRPPTEEQTEQRCIGHGEGQQHAMDDARRIAREVRDCLTALDEPEDYWRGACDACNNIIEALPLAPAVPSPADPQPEVRTAAQFVVDTFSRDEAQGYRSKDRQFAIEILGKALAGHLSPEAQKDEA